MYNLINQTRGRAVSRPDQWEEAMTQEARANGGSAPRFAVRYYTETGNTKKLADEFAKGFLRK